MQSVPNEYKKFVQSVRRKCKYHGIKLILSPSKRVVLTEDYENECSGYFDEVSKCLVVAAGMPVESWLQTFVHESSHMDQWISDDRWVGWAEMCGKMWSYMDGTLLLNKSQLNKVIDGMIELELDCEIRSIEKIKKWGLPIDIDEYIRKANVYLYSYRLMGEYKVFPNGIYNDPVLINSAPKVFQADYKHIPKKLAIESHRFFQTFKRA